MTATTYTDTQAGGAEPGLLRKIDWRGAFWVASGVPALVLFSIGGIAGTTGKVAFLVWAVSMLMGFIQSFTYAEIAGLFPNKSGGASVYGAAAWVRYAKVVAPLSVWCNWFAWTPVLSLGCSIAASYILNALAPIPVEGSPEVVAWLAANPGQTVEAAIAALTPGIRTFELIGYHEEGAVGFAINAPFIIGVILMLAVFAVQHRGILGTANIQKVIGILVIVPLLIIGIVPLLNGAVNWANFSGIVPPAVAYAPEDGAWNIPGWTLVLGGLFIAAWSTYGFETAICYTREFRNPASDTFKAIFYSGLLCLVLFILVPFTFQGVLGLEGMLATPIVDGSGVAEALAGMVGGGPLVKNILVVMMILALLLSIMTAMAGSSRTLYQGAVDGWLPRYLSKVNHHGAPVSAMWTDLLFNVVILAIASADATSFFFILAVSNCGYIIFNFLNLNSGWIHRIDSARVPRPYKAPNILLIAGIVLAFVNAALMGAGAKVWNPNALWAGLIMALLIIPVFAWRHWVQDGGVFPAEMLADLTPAGSSPPVMGTPSGRPALERKAGVLPYVTLAAGLAVVFLSNWLFTLE